jgi:hypothetical protein
MGIPDIGLEMAISYARRHVGSLRQLHLTFVLSRSESVLLITS